MEKFHLLWLFLWLMAMAARGFQPIGSLDLQELMDVQYSVTILDTPVSDEETLLDESMTAMVMVNKEGQKYRCSVPKMEEKEEDKEDGGQDAAPDVKALLQPLEEAHCIFKTKDWWTYEICYNRQIKQYHVENDRPVGAVMVLGVHSPDLDNWEASNRTYQAQYYVNGSNCDLTSRPRQTELRFVCNEAATVEFVGDIFEPQSCEYTIVVHTARLCSVPWLRPAAEATPLPIACNPLLPKDQFSRYQVYQERKKLAIALAEKEKKEKQLEALASKGDGRGAGGLLDLMGDTMAERLVGEIHTLLDNAVAGEGGGGGLKVLDLRGDDEKESPAVEVQQYRKELKEVNAKKENWEVVHKAQKASQDPDLKELVNERNKAWRKVHDAKQVVKKYTSQLHDTETFIKNENMDTFQSREILDKLEQTRKVIEKALVKAREDVAVEEEKAKDISHKIVAQQGKLKLHEEFVWKRKLDILHHKMKTGPEQFTGSGSASRFSNIVKEMASDYMKATGEPLVRMDDYFDYAKRYVKDSEAKSFEVLRKFMRFANKDLALNAVEAIKLNADEEMLEFSKEVDSLPEEKRIKVAKFKDIVKDDVREKFSDILKEVSDELELPEGDVDQDEAMRSMSELLDQLVSKLAGPSEKMAGVKKQALELKQAAEAVASESVNLKRDGKRSVKKELREDLEEAQQQRGDIPIREADEDYDEEITKDIFDEEDEDAKLDAAITDTRKKLEEAEAEVARLEDESKNVKVSVTKLGTGEELNPEEAAKIAKRLEGTIKDKLAKLGIDTGSRPIEVKLVTSTIPEGLSLGDEGDPQNDQQVQSMFFNMMTGNIQGYEDIDSQRKAENSYKFHWNENMMEDIESKISSLGGELEEPSLIEGDAIVVEDEALTPEEITLSEEDDFDGLGVGVEDQRERPSSKNSKIDEESENELSRDDL